MIPADDPAPGQCLNICCIFLQAAGKLGLNEWFGDHAVRKTELINPRILPIRHPQKHKNTLR